MRGQWTGEPHVALLRGINVGRAKRVAMADLRTLIEGLGYGNVRTLLNSGNAVFTVPSPASGDPAARIESAIASTLGVACRVSVLTLAEVDAAVAGNPLGAVADTPSRLLVMILKDSATGTRVRRLASGDWAPEALSSAGRVAYLWCADGIATSRLLEAVTRVVGDDGTARNLTTMTKLRDLAATLAVPDRT